MCTTLWAMCAFLLMVPHSMAQNDRAVLTGVVTDAAERAIPGATIELVMADGGIRRSVVTDDWGSFTIAALPIGIASITVQKDGFQIVRYDDVEFVVGQTRTINVRMSVAGLVEEIAVETTIPLLTQNSAE